MRSWTAGATHAVFYDALTYACTLKGWLHEPPQKSAALTQAPQRQQEHVDELVAAVVEQPHYGNEGIMTKPLAVYVFYERHE
ncbi:uncharacterized protein BXZ73DRAFT_98878 [Epithele typhae]|uniref:uncharacterized protein n=1 Tax=Epithele typhae TaxID=378194 RepID=UPI0020088439|nr:uncharacterized protein BXZ73DRAFT_98878 [Epithele typhae]KAH9940445.1 hypothetical protein BXZ73DRAFT_98878 [Epithele typhae]